MAGLVLLVLFAAEVAVFVLVAHFIGYGLAIVALLLTSVLGGALVRAEGARAWRSLRATVSAGGLPAGEVSEGGVLIAAGALLVIPGFITDVVGLLLIVPGVRHVAGRWLLRRSSRPFPGITVIGGRRRTAAGGGPDLTGGAAGDFLRGFPGSSTTEGGHPVIDGELGDHDRHEGPD